MHLGEKRTGLAYESGGLMRYHQGRSETLTYRASYAESIGNQEHGMFSELSVEIFEPA